MVCVGRYVTVSIKVRREVKERLESCGVKVSDVLRRAIEEELRRVELSEIEGKIKELKDLLSEFNTEFIVRSVREFKDLR